MFFKRVFGVWFSKGVSGYYKCYEFLKKGVFWIDWLLLSFFWGEGEGSVLLVVGICELVLV